MRYALYFSPEAGSDLEVAASSWLGRSMFEKRAKAQPPANGLDLGLITSAPRRYGFHATIVAPFELQTDVTPQKLNQRIAELCQTQQSFELPPLQINRIGNFLALTPENAPHKANELAAKAVRALHPLQADLSSADVKRRLKSGLSKTQRHYLESWNYPFVLDEYRLHFTLSNGLSDEECEAVMPLAHSHFHKALQQPVLITQLALFIEPERGAAFELQQTFSFSDHS